jgi:lipopolysaccharide biosynthesis glycosyltransferase
MIPLRIFIGHDAREQDAYDVAVDSLREHASVPLNIARLSRLTLPWHRPVSVKNGQLWCPISQAPMSTDFAIARFAVPRLVGHHGWALFTDCDVLFLGDVAELFALADDRYAVMVVQHEQPVADALKMDDQLQLAYPRKNWSSVVLWNCAHPANVGLTWETIEQWPGRDLHAFRWLEDADIGRLPLAWNFLVDVNRVEQLYGQPVKLLHYTLGGPWFGRACSFADEWNRAQARFVTRAA